ncbi:hypothetical protein CCMSSC00406_0007291 [Pleurotus cornucopiae]|uniref:Uncharacterized protein n=1 Tax=Pleurotus cornucopiae TaxID=5321 RepID=A0ACB7ILE1_PLECO|nr:hypothetical protein CCMSSC00406_0007291 [Pleurotus cornucopiae]
MACGCLALDLASLHSLLSRPISLSRPRLSSANAHSRSQTLSRSLANPPLSSLSVPPKRNRSRNFDCTSASSSNPHSSRRSSIPSPTPLPSQPSLTHTSSPTAQTVHSHSRTSQSRERSPLEPRYEI